MGVSDRRLGPAVFREGEGFVEVAAPKALRGLCEMIEQHWEGIAAYCQAENKVSLGFLEGLNNKIRVIQKRAYGLRYEEYLRLKVLTCTLTHT